MKFEVNRGRFLHKIDYGPHFPEPSFAIEEALGCPMECEYCFVKAHYTEDLIIYTNTDKIIDEMNEVIESYGRNAKFYIGEFSEPLITGRYSDALLKILTFAESKGVNVEIRTKWNDIAPIKEITPLRSVILAWSFMPEKIRALLEKRTPPISERLEALKGARDRGWNIGVRLEPLIYYSGWEEDYRELIEVLRRTIGDIEIYTGPLRLTPLIKRRICRENPHSILLAEETVRCPDGKFRYPSPLRRMMYAKLYEFIGRPYRIYMEERYLLNSLSFLSPS